jgi:hypothetical protein
MSQPFVSLGNTFPASTAGFFLCPHILSMTFVDHSIGKRQQLSVACTVGRHKKKKKKKKKKGCHRGTALCSS